MHFTTSTTGLLLGLMSVWSCTAAPAEEIRDVLALPSTCSKKTTACHTYTAYTAAPSCSQKVCPELTGIMCPMIIKVTTSSVPCATDCCPTTKTKTMTTSCSSCPTGCVIPTQTVTMTTGCKVTSTPGSGVTLTAGSPGGSVTLTPGRV